MLEHERERLAALDGVASEIALRAMTEADRATMNGTSLALLICRNRLDRVAREKLAKYAPDDPLRRTVERVAAVERRYRMKKQIALRRLRRVPMPRPAEQPRRTSRPREPHRRQARSSTRAGPARPRRRADDLPDVILSQVAA